jgi:antitoxin PrlF
MPARGEDTRRRGLGFPTSATSGVTVDDAESKKDVRPRTSARARLRPKAQLTLAEEIRRALRVSEGDEIEFSVQEDGTISVRGYVSVPSDQAWYFTRELQAGRLRAQEQIAAGSGTVHDSADAMFGYLDDLGAVDDLYPRHLSNPAQPVPR